MDREVLFKPLMTEEELLVTPVRFRQLGLGDHLSDMLFGAAELFGHVKRVHIVQHGARRN